MQEILIKSIIIEDSTLIVAPIGCPMEHSAELIKLDDAICCLYNDRACPYLESVRYNMKEGKKVLFCKGGE